jgi:uncharacterized protein YecE (DUF72 family)
VIASSEQRGRASAVPRRGNETDNEHDALLFLITTAAQHLLSHHRSDDDCRQLHHPLEAPRAELTIELLEGRLELLGSKCDPVLFQLPARFQADNVRLAAFLQKLSPKHRYAFEFRHRSWYDDSTFSLLSDHDIALCISDHHDAPS